MFLILLQFRLQPSRSNSPEAALADGIECNNVRTMRKSIHVSPPAKGILWKSIGPEADSLGHGREPSYDADCATHRSTSGYAILRHPSNRRLVLRHPCFRAHSCATIALLVLKGVASATPQSVPWIQASAP